MGQQIMVIGLGRLGRAVAEELEELGHEVLAVDSDPKVIDEIAEDVTQAVAVDATSEEALSELGAQAFDAGIVALSSDERASILITVILKRLGVKFVLARAHNPLHGEILRMVGADRVVYPEEETGRRVAHSFQTSVLDYFEIGPGYGIEKMKVPEHLAGKTLRELELNRRFGLTPMFLRRGKTVTANPGPEERLQSGDELSVAGPDEKLERLRP